MIRFCCPQCDSPMEVDESFGGRPARCPTCGTEIRIPTSEETKVSSSIEETSKSGATTVRIGGESIEMVPPVDLMAILSVGLLAASVGVVLLVGLTRIAWPPWTIGTTLGAGVALLAAMTGLPAYYNIRKSRGRKRGKRPALVAAIGGAALTVVLGATAVAGWIINFSSLRPTCEENLGHIYQAMMAYAKDHNGRVLPPSLESLVKDKYLDSRRWLTCPDYPVRPGSPPTYILHVSTPTPNLNDPLFKEKAHELAIVSDGAPYNLHEDGQVRVLLLDGHVEKVPYDKWQMFLDQQQQLRREIAAKARQREEAAAHKEEESP